MRNKPYIPAAAAAGILTIALGASVGSSDIPLHITILTIAGKIASFLTGYAPGVTDAKTAVIVWELRLPRAVLAFCAGGALSVSGAIIQSILKNRLASPYILGISSGASFGAALVMLSGFTIPVIASFTLPLAGFLFSIVTVFAVVIFSARLDRSMTNNTVILFGMVISLFVNALLILLTALFREELRGLIFWQMGSFAMRGWPYLRLLLPFLIAGLAIILRYSREADIISFGDDMALTSGVEIKKIKNRLFAASAMLTGSAVSICGTIGFVDLIAPHIARRIGGPEHRVLLPLSFAAGGVLSVFADIIARTALSPSELPVGAVTAIIGAPFFVWVYFKKQK